MINVITRRAENPKGEFQNLWLNTKTGNLYVWNGEPVIIGKMKDGGLIISDVFNMEFVHTPVKNEQVYEYLHKYSKFPVMVLVQVIPDGYKGSDVEIAFGSLYGKVKADKEKFVVVNPVGNVELDGNLKISCKPTEGSVQFNLIIVTYE